MANAIPVAVAAFVKVWSANPVPIETETERAIGVYAEYENDADETAAEETAADETAADGNDGPVADGAELVVGHPRQTDSDRFGRGVDTPTPTPIGPKLALIPSGAGAPTERGAVTARIRAPKARVKCMLMLLLQEYRQCQCLRGRMVSVEVFAMAV